MTVRAISTIDRRPIHPAVQFISARDPARVAARRVAVPRGSLFTNWVKCTVGTDETPRAAAGHPPARKCAGVASSSRMVFPRDGNAQRRGAGWAAARDRFPGRV